MKALGRGKGKERKGGKRESIGIVANLRKRLSLKENWARVKKLPGGPPPPSDFWEGKGREGKGREG